jgi:hypothetical protein
MIAKAENVAHAMLTRHLGLHLPVCEAHRRMVPTDHGHVFGEEPCKRLGAFSVQQRLAEEPRPANRKVGMQFQEQVSSMALKLRGQAHM